MFWPLLDRPWKAQMRAHIRCSIIKRFFVAASLCCSATSVFASSVTIQEKTIACRVGQFVGYDSHFLTSEEDTHLVAEIIAERERGNTVRSSFCDNAESAGIREGFLRIIGNRIDEADACVRRQMQMGIKGNWQAMLAFVKYEDQALNEIKKLVDYSITNGKSSEDASKTAELIIDNLTGINTIKNDVTKVKNMLVVTHKGDDTARHLFHEMFGDKYTDAANDVFVKATSPWLVFGELYKLVTDAVTSGDVQAMTSFSHSLCQ